MGLVQNPPTRLDDWYLDSSVKRGIKELYENNAQDFLAATDAVYRIVFILRTMTIQGVRHDSPMPSDTREMLQEQLAPLAALFDRMGARASRDMTKRVIEAFGQSQLLRDMDHAVQNIRSVFHDEMASWHVIFLSEREAKMFDHGESEVFGQLVLSRFPSAVVDMSEACKCMALDRWTAAAFHCMGVVEVGIRALCRELDVTIDLEAKDCTWSKMLSAMNSRIKPSGHQPAPRKQSNPETWLEDEPFFNEVLMNLAFFQQCYRNPIMHFRSVGQFSESQSRIVMDNTRMFMQNLSSRVAESP